MRQDELPLANYNYPDRNDKLTIELISKTAGVNHGIIFSLEMVMVAKTVRHAQPPMFTGEGDSEQRWRVSTI